ncbi:MAG: hypothetical protein HYR51_01255 [Candidatus Rokubacteria bacterium]|nr:hypothetical protein [Candidatus Rokubacteria bacterium]
MNTWLRSTVAVLALGLLAGPAGASECPGLIAQARTLLEQYRKTPGFAAVKDARIAAVETNLRAAEAAHGGGNHDEAVQKANEALKLLRQ